MHCDIVSGHSTIFRVQISPRALFFRETVCIAIICRIMVTAHLGAGLGAVALSPNVLALRPVVQRLASTICHSSIPAFQHVSKRSRVVPGVVEGRKSTSPCGWRVAASSGHDTGFLGNMLECWNAGMILETYKWTAWLRVAPRPQARSPCIWMSGWGVRQSAGHRHVTGTGSLEGQCRHFEFSGVMV